MVVTLFVFRWAYYGSKLRCTSFMTSGRLPNLLIVTDVAAEGASRTTTALVVVSPPCMQTMKTGVELCIYTGVEVLKVTGCSQQQCKYFSSHLQPAAGVSPGCCLIGWQVSSVPRRKVGAAHWLDDLLSYSSNLHGKNHVMSCNVQCSTHVQ